MSTNISGFLFDANMSRVLNQAPIGFSDGKELITTRTAEDGSFSLALPHDGLWILAPHPEYNTFYAFTPVFITTSGDQTELGQIEVQGDNASNAQMLQTFVSNVMGSCQDLFEKRIATFDPLKLTEDDVKAEAAYVFNIFNSALQVIVRGAPVPPSDPNHLFPGQSQPVAMPMTAVLCSTCRTKYGNNQAALQNCLCCPSPCTPP